jgi:hypothetical protein
MSKVDRAYIRQHRLVQDDPAADPFSVPEFADSATEQRRLVQLRWPRNLFCEPASIAELLAEAAQLVRADWREPHRQDRPAPQKIPQPRHHDRSVERGKSNMNKILLASAVEIGLSIGAVYAATPPNGHVPTGARLAMRAQTTQQLHSIGTVPAVRGIYADPSWANPTGQVEYGPNGTISLFAPSSGGNG